MAKQVLNWKTSKNIVIFSGAGLSVAAGLQTFRGAGGLWNQEELLRLSSAETLKSDPLAVWAFFRERLGVLGDVEPTLAHRRLAEVEAQLTEGQRMSIITTNIDGLHLRAGNTRVVEFHGSARRVRCMNPGCRLVPFEDPSLPPDRLPGCPVCGQPLRPDVVLFGEFIPAATSTAALKALVGCDLFVSVGSSGSVWPSSGFVQKAFDQGAHTVCINLSMSELGDPFYLENWQGPAEELIPALFGDGADDALRTPGLWPLGEGEP